MPFDKAFLLSQKRFSFRCYQNCFIALGGAKPGMLSGGPKVEDFFTRRRGGAERGKGDIRGRRFYRAICHPEPALSEAEGDGEGSPGCAAWGRSAEGFCR